MNTVLLVSHVRLDESGGRAEKMRTRKRLLEERGWRVLVGYVDSDRSRPAAVLDGVRECLALAAREEVDVLNSVNSPPHMHVVALVVNLLTGVPWLAEFRDPLASHVDVDPDAPIAKVRAVIERLVVDRADHVAWHDGIQVPDDYFERRYPHVPDEKVTKLPYFSYDPRAFEGVEPVEYDEFTVTYAGSFYEGWIEPDPFLAGLARYLEGSGDAGGASEAGEGEGDDLRVQFYGDWWDRHDRVARELGVRDHLDVHGFVVHEEVVPVLTGSDALLFVGGSDPRNALNVPSKIADYVAARRPILAVVDPSFRVADVIRDLELGIVVPPDDPDAIADALGRLRSGAYEYDPDPAAVELFDRERKVERFAALLDAVAERRPVGETDAATAGESEVGS